MPIYVYQCETCGITFERRQRMSESPLVDCPECGGNVHRVIQPVGIVFKGAGFYVTDNRGSSPTVLPASKKGEKDSPADTKTVDSGSKAEKTDKAAD